MTVHFDSEMLIFDNKCCIINTRNWGKFSVNKFRYSRKHDSSVHWMSITSYSVSIGALVSTSQMMSSVVQFTIFWRNCCSSEWTCSLNHYFLHLMYGHSCFLCCWSVLLTGMMPAWTFCGCISIYKRKIKKLYFFNFFKIWVIDIIFGKK